MTSTHLLLALRISINYCVACHSESGDLAADNTTSKRSLRAERRVQLATSKSSPSSPTRQSQRSLLASASTASPGTGRPLRGKTGDTETVDKSGGAASEDGGGGVPAEQDRSTAWIHVTQRELHGLGDLVEFLENLAAADRRVPSDIHSAEKLLSSAKVISCQRSD